MNWAAARPGRPAGEVSFFLHDLRGVLERLSFPLDLPQAGGAREERDDLVSQLDDYILPRYDSLDAPLLAVIGGSTGSGKSALVNALARTHASASGAIRPTTRRPQLVHNPDDARWFEGTRILPHLARVRGGATEGENAWTELGLVGAPSVPHNLALLDSPDIDSVVESNRRLASQLLAAADLWLFVTTAARYADAIPWSLLDDAAHRNIVIAVVLNRVPAGVSSEVRSDLAARLSERGLASAPLFVISETDFDADGFIPDEDVAPIRRWLAGLVEDSSARSAVARQTLGGAVDDFTNRASLLAPAVGEQRSALVTLASQVDDAFASAHSKVMEAMADGSVLRGEVLARWQDFVGTGELLRQVEAGVGKIRDRISSWFRGGQTQDPDDVGEAIEDGIARLLVGTTEQAVNSIERAWARGLGGERLVAGASQGLRTHEERVAAATDLVRDWQGFILHLVEDVGQDKRSSARLLSLGVNTIGIALMIVIFASTAGLSGGEVVVAGSTAVVAQKVLEAVFGDDAVRQMAKQARDDLSTRAGSFMVADAEPFRTQLSTIGVDAAAGEELEEILTLLAAARAEEDRS